MTSTDQPWSSAQATKFIRGIANDPQSNLTWRRHALRRQLQRGLIMSDVRFVLRNGFVREQSEEESSVPGLYKYAIEGLAPNSERRILRIIVVPDLAETTSRSSRSCGRTIDEGN